MFKEVEQGEELNRGRNKRVQRACITDEAEARDMYWGASDVMQERPCRAIFKA